MQVKNKQEPLPNHELMLTWVSFIHASTYLKDSLEGELIAQLNITLAEQDLLKQLAVNESRLTLTELAARIFLSKAGLTKMLNRLEAQSLVKREPVPGNRKSMNAVLTKQGHSCLKKSRKILRNFVQKNVGAHLSDKDLRALSLALRAILQGHGRWEAQSAHLRGEPT